ncbi:sesquipedalian-1 isoform X2 [Apis laboriosa]|uniref:Sesquipedalian-1 n=3 Tax=Apis TaxID=7459 RepID=A0A7M7IG83_APIME|nr:sesquipedalian-1 [Apis florea]XP_016768715.1 sesquipedalian-1 [Apis mellifera]XP_016911511.1 sesquipedalian-1-like [Apis cerana]XP_016911520.1 sesquipedalian-1-like [Apis cerana]XP_026299006.1 sesquipedalian-1 [Apis mellifera]XP_031366240.1 sesquipedalian-1-like [Apis dorsata]XP_031772330.1 sesquipedalian-1 [Apis florea]XP_043784785.1 sesquipedalian-1 isoform X2 [Apis laboriosa]XP_043784786.1 sesquipedalian-1 isoform X2 [Apis laboriosa]XP_061943437.1 sesquipedalian-1-like [Apis cerana]|eukprot:XP_016768715.1 sesquipedalian-1 [Apis mellifera]
MKINEKNMVAFATSATPVDREGWLYKRGELNRGYQKRWFVLKGNILFYFDRRGDKEPVGMIVLEGCTIELAEDEEQFGFQIVFHGPNNRNYALAAESQESMEQWMKALACASYDYMKLMVADLQRQLDAAEEETTMVVAPSQSPKAPPRQRHNPFNRSEFHHRSQSVRSAPGRTENVPRTRITFRELHNMYGRRILADLNEWRHTRKAAEAPLISF